MGSADVDLKFAHLISWPSVVSATCDWTRVGICLMLVFHGSFRGLTRENAVLTVEKLPKRMETTFPSLKSLGTHYGRHCEPFSDKKCSQIARFCIYKLNIFRGWNPRPPQKHSPGAWNQTPIPAWLASVSMFLFCETTCTVVFCILNIDCCGLIELHFNELIAFFSEQFIFYQHQLCTAQALYRGTW